MKNYDEQTNVSHTPGAWAKYVWRAAMVLVFGGATLTTVASAIPSTDELNAVIRRYGENKNFVGLYGFRSGKT